MDKSKHMTAEHILAACRILSCTRLDVLRDKATMSEKYHATRMHYNQSYAVNEMLKLHYYFEAQSLWPRFWAKDENEAARDYGTPWPLVIIASLVRNGFTSEEAWTMPESQAVWLHIANSQAAGAKINVITDKEWDAMENFRKNNKPPEPIK